MRDRSFVRYLAPIALVAVLVAGVVVVTSGGGKSSSHQKTTTASSASAKSGKKFYRVKPGDLLSKISDKTGVNIATIIKLNPDVDPQALQAGQLIRVRK
jgi:LysM repeat protein